MGSSTQHGPTPTTGGRVCQWCREASIPAAARDDAKFCSQRCRQASHRFHRSSRGAGASLRLEVPSDGDVDVRRFAYADPPYPGLAHRYYADHPDYGGEVDHRDLVARLAAEFDGWALSTSAAALPEVLAVCPAGARVAAWFRGERPTTSYSPLAAWEPVIYFGARRFLSSGSGRRLDALVYIARPRLTDSRRVIGAKPAEFCLWIFQLLGALPNDTFADLFPGSGGVARAWATFQGEGMTADDLIRRMGPPPAGDDESRAAAASVEGDHAATYVGFGYQDPRP